MRRIHIGGAALNQTPLDWEGNQKRIIRALQQAREQGVQILCLPELCISGYGCEDAFFHRHITEYSLQSLVAILPETRGLVAAIGLPLEIENVLYNCVATCTDGQLISLYAKQRLAGDGIHYEPRWFKAWSAEGLVWEHPLLEEPVAVTPFPVEVDGIRIGYEICEDAWTGRRVGASHYLHGADIILNPSASHFAFGKTHTRQSIVLEGSRAFGCAYVLANLVGNEAGRAIYDGEILIAQEGKWLAQNLRLGYQDVQLVSTVVDVEAHRTAKRRLESYPVNPGSPVLLGDADMLYDCGLPVQHPISLQQMSKEQELYRAITLGLWDYMRKSFSKGFVISLSGGADSGACALLAAAAIKEALDELGKEEIKRLAPALSTTEVSKLVTCVYQGTENSSDETLKSARSIAEGIGADFHVWPVQVLFDEYRAMIEKTLERRLSWEQDDVALQNIQARLRAPGIWMMANIQGGLLLTTSNRSEVAVGYATMDGDTAGGLAPIGGLDKAYLREWLRWAETELSMPWLAPLNTLQPTAELRPKENHQTDEGDLMPFPLLNAIEKQAFVNCKTPLQIFDSLGGGAWPDDQLRDAIIKFFRLWSRNQWKRERYAPSFHLDDHNLDPRSWYRYPILSGGWQKELAELEETV